MNDASSNKVNSEVTSRCQSQSGLESSSSCGESNDTCDNFALDVAAWVERARLTLNKLKVETLKLRLKRKSQRKSQTKVQRKARQCRKRSSNTSLSMDGATDAKLQEIFKNELSSGKVGPLRHNFTDLKWLLSIRSGAYTFKAEMNGRRVHGCIFDRSENRKRAKIIHEMQTILYYKPQLSTSFAFVAALDIHHDIVKPSRSKVEQVGKTTLENDVAVWYLRGESMDCFFKANKSCITRSWQSVYRQLFDVLAKLHQSGYCEL